MKSMLYLGCFGAWMTLVFGKDSFRLTNIDQALENRFKYMGADHTEDLMISFNENIKTAIEQITKMSFPNNGEKRSALTEVLTKLSTRVQQPLTTFLSKMNINYQTFWINNKVIVRNANYKIVKDISSIQGVGKIEIEPVAELEYQLDERLMKLHFPKPDKKVAPPKRKWNIKHIRANELWEQYTGEGVVVAGIDTGVQYTHESVRSNWRSEYGWFDTVRGRRKRLYPVDEDGHGTRTMAIIVGGKGFGVAPKATWIACRAGRAGYLRAAELFACAEWVQCPTKPNGKEKNCDMAPKIVSNSWGYERGTWFDDVIKAWHEAGIIPVFAVGNSGPACETARTPGDRPGVISVGATDISGRIWANSSLGPSPEGAVKPDISAPGVFVTSASIHDNSSYALASGTSVACPHVSGVIALMLEKDKDLTYRQIYRIITSTAITKTLDTSTAPSCGGRFPSDFPNYVYGHGRIDALNAVMGVK